jgi:hypothetical protein
MRRFLAVEALFTGRHFYRQIIILCVSWYASFKALVQTGVGDEMAWVLPY